MKKLICMLLCLIFILCGCGSKQAETVPETTIPATFATEAPAITEEPTTTEDSSVSYDMCAELIESYLSEKLSGVSAHAEGSTVVVDICTTGISDAASRAISGEQAFMDRWGDLVESQVSLCKALQKTYLSAIGVTDASVMINVLNDKNPDNALLIIMAGEVIYDVVNNG